MRDQMTHDHISTCIKTFYTEASRDTAYKYFQGLFNSNYTPKTSLLCHMTCLQPFLLMLQQTAIPSPQSPTIVTTHAPANATPLLICFPLHLSIPSLTASPFKFPVLAPSTSQSSSPLSLPLPSPFALISFLDMRPRAFV